ncbi:MAG: chemotaxis protein CheA, partial [Gammaproteobacteria bacterium]
MSFTEDEEILQDFLVEATEIIEQLGEQLVELESSPQDNDLLNAVFRGYHTIKGGAGFLSITPLVEVCHHTEDVFNVLRQGERVVDAQLMDVILNAHDAVTGMIESVQQGEEPAAADPDLLQRLAQYTRSDAAPAEAAAPPAEEAPVAAAEATPPVGGQAASATGGDEISDDEFEALLDQLHGSGAPAGAAPDGAQATVSAEPDEVASDPAPAAPSATVGAQSEEISDDEFEALLDQLHGGSAPGMAGQSAAAPAAPSAAPKSDAAATASSPSPAAPSATAAKVKPSSSSKPAGKGKKDAAAPQGETTVRVDTRRLDDIMNLVGELVLVRNRLTTLESSRADEEIAMAVDNLDLVTSDLQAAVMKTRMQPIKKVFGRFPRVVRDLARSLNKDITLELIGEETDLDKNLVEALADPLVHLVRNAVDHGIELPEVREQAGKSRNGTVVLSAEQEGDHILLTIADDGAGMDADVLRRKAVEKGVLDEEAAARLGHQECYQLIFMPGFSTKTEISDVSGRGVGMDVVKTKIT